MVGLHRRAFIWILLAMKVGNLVYYGVRSACATDVDTMYLFYSTGGMGRVTYGLRPVISVSVNLLDISNTSTDGSSASTAWNIK